MAESPEAANAAPIFLPVPVKPRHDGWTPDKQRAFIEHLADTGCVKRAAGLVGMSEQSAYSLRRRRGAGAFNIAWDAALASGIRQLTSIAFEKAIAGAVKRTFYHGQLINEEVMHSERLLIYLLEKGERLLGNAKARHAVTEDWDAAMDRLGSGESGEYRVWQTDRGVWLTNFPPPPNFTGFADRQPGSPQYSRGLTREEAKANSARRAHDEAAAGAARDRFFKLNGDR